MMRPWPAPAAMTMKKPLKRKECSRGRSRLRQRRRVFLCGRMFSFSCGDPKSNHVVGVLAYDGMFRIERRPSLERPSKQAKQLSSHVCLRALAEYARLFDGNFKRSHFQETHLFGIVFPSKFEQQTSFCGRCAYLHRDTLTGNGELRLRIVGGELWPCERCHISILRRVFLPARDGPHADAPFRSRLWCRGEDSNLHRIAPTRPSSVRVYQFHHHGTKNEGSRSVARREGLGKSKRKL